MARAPSPIGTERRTSAPGRPDGIAYKWVALTNTTMGAVLATIDASIMLIAMPSVFRGIGLDPLEPSNSFYLLWLILGYLIVSSVLVVSLGRLGDLFGRVRMYTLGFAVYTVASLVLAITWMSGTEAAVFLVVMRMVQGIGAAFILANSAAILTDAFPSHQRGLALGINNVAGISGTFLGLVLGGLLAPINWRLIFLVSVPFGVAGTIWAFYRLKESVAPRRAGIDWWGNLSFAAGLILVMVGITYGIQPYGGQDTGWTNPTVIAELVAGTLLLGVFTVIELRVHDPMFRLGLFRVRAYSAGVVSSFLSALARGGLMFMLIIWLQGIWLPQHGYDYAATPLWAGIYLLPLSLGFLAAGPASGILSDRLGTRPFATGGMVGAAVSFALFQILPINFPYWAFALLLLLNGLSMGAFAAPNRAGVMNTLPYEHRGAGAGMQMTFQNSAQVLSIGIFFTLMIIGLSAVLPGTLYPGLVHHGVPAAAAARVASLPPVSILFAAFLGYNPVQHLVGPAVLHQLTPANTAILTGRAFFPSLLATPFNSGLHIAFTFSAIVCLIAAAASWSRGPRRHAPAPELPARVSS